MLVGIHQSHYLPWLRYFEKVARCDVFVVLDNIQFSKNGWQNRNKVKTAAGATLLTAPVSAGFGDTLDAVRLKSASPWRKKHWATIQQAYAKAPFFADYAGLLADTYAREWTFLNDLNRHLLEGFVAALGIDTRIEYASALEAPGTATERLVHLIQAVGGDGYYSGAYALDEYLDAAMFRTAGIEVAIQEWHAPRYAQLHGDFVPDLSIVDLIMNVGPDSLSVLMAGGDKGSA